MTDNAHNGVMTQQVNFAAIPEFTLGWRLQLALKHAHLKQDDLIEKFEVSRQTVSRWCNDVGPAPKNFILEVIAEMCGVSTQWLIAGDSAPPPNPGDAPAVPIRRKANARGRKLPRLDSNQEPIGQRSVSDIGQRAA